MKRFVCPYCNNDLMHHSDLCGGEIGQANPVPEIHPVAELLESVPMSIRILALAILGLGLGYLIAFIGGLL